MGRDPLFRPMLKLIGERYEETKDWFAKIQGGRNQNDTPRTFFNKNSKTKTHTFYNDFLIPDPRQTDL